MTIHNNTWSIGEKGTSAKLTNMYNNEINSANNIHPQYGNSMGEMLIHKEANQVAYQNINTYFPFYHLKNITPHAQNKYKLLVSFLLIGADTYQLTVKLFSFAVPSVDLADTIYDSGAAVAGSIAATVNWSPNLSTGAYMLKVQMIAVAVGSSYSLSVGLVSADPN